MTESFPRPLMSMSTELIAGEATIATLMETTRVALLDPNACVAARREADKDVVIIRGPSGGFCITLPVVAFARTMQTRPNK